MWQAYYNRERFRYIHQDLVETRVVDYRGNTRIRKTGCFYGEKFNIYIDTSDGVNEDLPIEEYCGRMQTVIRDSAGKPFLYFKCIYSPSRSRRLSALATRHGGQVVPFMHWSFNRDWYRYLDRHRDRWRKRKAKADPEIDVGMGANLSVYNYPKPNQADDSVSWHDWKLFGLGSGTETGYWEVATRRNIHDQLQTSTLSYDFCQKVPYRKYVARSLGWRVIVAPPGMGEYTQRIFDHGPLGQCMVLRKSSYDFGHSWKSYIPEVNWSQSGWQAELAAVVDDWQGWGDKIDHYFAQYMTPSALANYWQEAVERFAAGEMGESQQLRSSVADATVKS